jgi:hypothetical protein
LDLAREPRAYLAESKFLLKFIPSAIWIILDNPSDVKCSLFLTSSATDLKSAKSKLLIPSIGYLSKKGMILFSMSKLFLI